LILRNADDQTKDEEEGDSTVGDLGKGATPPTTDPVVKVAPAGDAVKGILDILTHPKVAPEPVVVQPPKRDKSEFFTMIIMEGKDSREVEFDLKNGGLPNVKNTDPNGGHTPAPLVSPETK
jgi:hypothetical protein